MRRSLLAMLFLSTQKKIRFDQQAQKFVIDQWEVRDAYLLAEAVLKFEESQTEDKERK